MPTVECAKRSRVLEDDSRVSSRKLINSIKHFCFFLVAMDLEIVKLQRRPDKFSMGGEFIIILTHFSPRFEFSAEKRKRHF